MHAPWDEDESSWRDTEPPGATPPVDVNYRRFEPRCAFELSNLSIKRSIYSREAGGRLIVILYA